MIKDCLDRYERLRRERPRLFADSEVFPLVKEREVMEAYARRTGKPVGVVYESPYRLLLVDLIEDGKGGCYPYERLVNAAEGGGVVMIPLWRGRILLLRQYRHPLREEQLCFPRGFSEAGSKARENAERELWEELGARCQRILPLGEVAPDSGLSASAAEVFLCELESYEPSLREEGVREILTLSEEELKQCLVRGEINDGFTLAALTLWQSKVAQEQ